MTRAKNKKDLTPEEKRAQALVPPEEQPYEVPGNWRWVRLGDITQIVGGGTPSTKIHEYYENGDVPWLSPADLSDYTEIYISHGAKNITQLGLEKSSAQLLPANTICLSSRAPIGYVVIAANPLCTNQGFKSFLPAQSYLPKYLYWYLRGNKDLLKSKASGTTFLELSTSKAAKIEFPLAPLKEQRRIIDRIERLFAALDAAKEKAQSVLASCEVRKAAILHKAFTGKLTERWRRSNNIADSSWESMSIGTIGDIITGSTPSTKHPEYFDGTIPFIKPTDLNQERHVLHSADYLSELGKEASRPVRVGSTCICCIGTIGKCGYLEVDGVTNQQINSIVPFDFMDNLFVYYYCTSNSFKNNLIENSSSTTLPIINKGRMAKLNIPVPQKAEQKTISDLLDYFITQENQIKASAQNVITQIDTLKKIILARAFRGELGTNDPAEAPAPLFD